VVASSRELSVRMACERHGEARQETVSLLGIPICHEDLQGVALGCRIGTAASEHTAYPNSRKMAKVEFYKPR
jgi:hypothetical protein